MKSKKYKFFIVSSICLYLASSVYFSNHFEPLRKIDGINVSFLNIDKAYYRLLNNSDYTNITIKSSRYIDNLKGKDIYFSKNISKNEINDILKNKNSLLWFLNVARENRTSSKITYDNAKLNNEIYYMNNVTGNNIENPEDAHLALKDGRIIILKEKQGTKVDVDVLKQRILEGLMYNSDIDLDKEDIYTKPNITSDSPEIIEEKKYIESLKNKKLNIRVANHTEKIAGNTLMNWFLNKKSLEKNCVDFIDNLKHKYDTYAKGIDSFKSQELGQVNVPSGGNYGWRIDKSKSVKKLITTVKDLKKSNYTYEPIYYNTTLNNADNIGDTYIEVSLKKQKVYCIKGGKKIFELDAVTGKNNKENETPKGVYKIWSKETNRYLTGEDYRSYVKIWMPFTYTGQGFHDASWQSSFGGDNYLYRGSRGCVNLSYGSAKKIYDNFKNNTPVIVY